ncbi:GNAT family N-acetyltransferase [uncultured Enterovirga sp.]|uniref:GNAT family N-acetyltransferase n=1 Tax=uncultured Enterovirga sp. TaxID=2026352 RepID=UPI0035CA046A
MVRIRPARTDEAPAVFELLGELWRETYEPLIGRDRVASLHERWHAPELLARQMVAAPASFLVAEFETGQIVGHAYASAFRPPVLFVVRLYVQREQQKQGIGSALLARLAVLHPDATTTRLFVIKGNLGALAFYRRHGFAVTGEAEEDGVVSLRLDRAGPGRA